MEKGSYLNRTIVLLLIVNMSLTMFTGCQSKNSTINNDKPKNIASVNNQLPEEKKKQIQDKIKALVKENTITQEQADKILPLLLANTQEFDGQKKNQNSKDSSKDHNVQNKVQNRPENNILSKLVDDGVITKDEEDIIMQRLGGRGNMQQSK